MAAEMDLEGVEEEVEVVVRAFPNMDLAQHVWKLDCEDVDKEVDFNKLKHQSYQHTLKDQATLF